MNQFTLNSIQLKIFCYILLFLIIPFSITFIYWDRPLEKTIEQKIGMSIQEGLTSVSQNIDNVFVDLQNALTVIVMNEDMHSLTRHPELFSDNDRYRITDNIMKTLYSTYLYKTEGYISILDFHQNIYTSWYAPNGKYEELRSSPWYDDVMEAAGSFVWINQFNNYTTRDSRPLITVAAMIADFKSIEGSGIAIISAVEQDVRKVFEELEGSFMIVDEKGTLISHADQTQIGINIADESYIRTVLAGVHGQIIIDDANERKLIMNYRTLDRTGWKLIQLLPYDDVFKEIKRIRKNNLMIMAVILALFIMITISISIRITKPLRLLNRKMNTLDPEQHHGYLVVYEKGTDEITELIHTYNRMVDRIRDLLDNLKTEYKQKEEMRFRMLQAQINPHFILNTLNNIKWMAYIKQANEVGGMITSLGAIMEASIGRDEHLITLRQEISYIENYIILQKIKYNEKLQFQSDISAELLDCEVIKFILQPIVENSIYHGIDQQHGVGYIKISAVKEGALLVITVTDNGLGMALARLEEVQQSLVDDNHDDHGKHSGSVGLRNVHIRIRSQYGKEYGLTIQSTTTYGTKVVIVLPFNPFKDVRDDV